MDKKILIGGQKAVVDNIHNVGGHYYVGLEFKNGSVGGLIVSKKQFESLLGIETEDDMEGQYNLPKMRRIAQAYFRFNSEYGFNCSHEDSASLFLEEVFIHDDKHIRILTDNLPSEVFDRDFVIESMELAIGLGSKLEIILKWDVPNAVEFATKAHNAGAIIMRSTKDEIKALPFGMVTSNGKTILYSDSEKDLRVGRVKMARKRIKQYNFLFEEIMHLGVELIKPDSEGNWVVYERDNYPPPKKIRFGEVVPNTVSRILNIIGLRKGWKHVTGRKTEGKET